MYILDTSALKGISAEKLRKAKETHDIAISPISFYELFSHLDEEDFPRQKGNVMKSQIPRLLHDPFAHLAIAEGIENELNPTRTEDISLVPQVLNNLANASTLEAFYSSFVTYPDGQSASCRDVAGRTRQALDEEEDGYINLLLKIKDNMLAAFPDCDEQGLSPQQLAKVIPQLIPDCKTQDGGIDMDRLSKKTTSRYIQLGYMVSRIAGYIRTAKNSGTKFTPDRNDCEDNYICMYLNLSDSTILVTGDKRTLAALKATKDSIQSCIQGNPEIKSCVISQEDFIKELGL